MTNEEIALDALRKSKGCPTLCPALCPCKVSARAVLEALTSEGRLVEDGYVSVPRLYGGKQTMTPKKA